MDTKALAEALEAWADESSTVTAYPDEPQSYSAAFPLVACRILDDEEQDVSDQFPTIDYEQVHVRVVSAELMIFVDPVPGWTSDQALYTIVDDLREALKADVTLGNRVEAASSLYRVEYVGEAQMADGTAANMATFTLQIAEKVRTR
jgi:hypothetical protein